MLRPTSWSPHPTTQLLAPSQAGKRVGSPKISLDPRDQAPNSPPHSPHACVRHRTDPRTHTAAGAAAGIAIRCLLTWPVGPSVGVVVVSWICAWVYLTVGLRTSTCTTLAPLLHFSCRACYSACSSRDVNSGANCASWPGVPRDINRRWISSDGYNHTTRGYRPIGAEDHVV